MEIIIALLLATGIVRGDDMVDTPEKVYEEVAEFAAREDVQKFIQLKMDVDLGLASKEELEAASYDVIHLWQYKQ